MNESLSNMIKGLILHYLNQGTLEEAIEQGQAAGLPEELLASLPGMVFEVTSAAGAIILGAHTEESIVEELEKRARSSGGGAEFNRKDAAALIKLTVGL
jgi:hypothetical protein